LGNKFTVRSMILLTLVIQLINDQASSFAF
jgi:hypothetical protein